MNKMNRNGTYCIFKRIWTGTYLEYLKNGGGLVHT